MVVVPGPVSPDEKVMENEKIYVLSTDKASVMVTLTEQQEDQVPFTIIRKDNILLPSDFDPVDLLSAVYQIAQNNSHKLSNKLSITWNPEEAPTNRFNMNLERLNSPDPENPKLTNLNRAAAKGTGTKLIELTITDKTDENHSSELPYIFMVREDTKFEELYKNIIHLHHNRLSIIPLSEITIKLQHPKIFFTYKPENTFSQVGFRYNPNPKENLDLLEVILNKSQDYGKSKVENYLKSENNEDDSQLRKLLIDENTFEGFNGENSKLSVDINTWPNPIDKSKSFYENYEKDKDNVEANNWIDWTKMSPSNDVKLSSPQDNAIELFGNEPLKCDTSSSSPQNDYKNSDNINNDTTTKYVGLINQAMTCYLNSLLQALYMTPEFRNALYNWEYIDCQDRDEATSIPYQLQKLFLNLQTSDKKAIETTSLTKSFGWDSAEAWHQHDVQELCRVMFDALEQKFKNTEQADLINRLYEGKMIDYVKCLECQTEKSREDTFLDIPLPVRPFGSNIAYDNIQEALRAFVQPETLDGVNQYFCETCNKKCDAHKGLKFTKFPYLLTLHLKRFDFDYNTLQRIKLNDRVSFPNILNLNSFIQSDDDESSPITDEDVGVKCDDSSTTDSVGWDEFVPPIKNGFSSTVAGAAGPSSAGEMNNHEQDDDEGIDMSNGPSTSSTNSQDNDNKYCTKTGPYNYELFSILIHSGSASGGHYYAYIKEFKTNDWICFNDQNLSSVTSSDIQRTFGGGHARTYYSSYYSSSTNAYMLMYRLIDEKRNCLPMTVDNFPPHIKDLLVKIKNSDDDCSKKQQQQQREAKPMIKLRISVMHPIERVYKNKKIYCFDGSDDKVKDIVYRVYKDFSLDDVVDVDDCRLVYWDPSNEFIQWSFDNKDNERMVDVLDDIKDDEPHELLLEIRDKNTKFKRYLPGGCKISIYKIDLGKKEIIDGPFSMRCLLTDTIGDLKKEITNEFLVNYDNILCCVVEDNVPNIINDNDDAELCNQGFIRGCNNKLFLTTKDTMKQLNYTITDIQNIFLKLSGDLNNIIRLTVNLPDMSKEVLEEMNIRMVDDSEDKKLIDNDDIDELISMGAKKKIVDDDSGFCSGNSSNKDDDKNKELLTETEECQEQTSNSEDSSLSDSDRTLVGDASEDDYDYRYNLFLSSQNNEDNDDDKKYCKIMKHNYKNNNNNNNNMYLNILVDKKMTLEKLTLKIEQYIGIKKHCFKLIALTNDDITDIDCKNFNTKSNLYKDNTIIDLKLNRILGKNECKIQIYQLDLNPSSIGSTFTLLFDLIVLNDTTIEELKNIIQRDMKCKLKSDIDLNRMRLRKKIYQTPSKKLFNHQKISDIMSTGQRDSSNPCLSLVVQELENDEVVVDDKQVIIIVKLYTGIAEDCQPYQEVVLSSLSATMDELRDKVAELSGIPGDCLMFAKGKWPAGHHGRIQWISDDDGKPQLAQDGEVFFYKNTSEKPRDSSSKSIFETNDSRRVLRDNRTPTVSTYRRRERALKIYVDDK